MTLRPAHELEELARLCWCFDARHQLRQRDDLCAKNFRLESAVFSRDYQGSNSIIFRYKGQRSFLRRSFLPKRALLENEFSDVSTKKYSIQRKVMYFSDGYSDEAWLEKFQAYRYFFHDQFEFCKRHSWISTCNTADLINYSCFLSSHILLKGHLTSSMILYASFMFLFLFFAFLQNIFCA